MLNRRGNELNTIVEPVKKTGVFLRFRKNKSGSAAIEFAFLALPFFMLIFATIESCITFAAEQLVTNAADKLAREIRTGQITFAQGKPTDLTEIQFKNRICNEIKLLINCDKNGHKLFFDVRSFTNFANIPKGIPRVGGSPTGDLDTTNFAFAPGGSQAITMMRIYYKWAVTTDIMRPYITNIKPSDGSAPTDYLIAAVTAVRNENY